uniref:hypothetical protein n=1 Tax=Pasteurella multocida TaxID=747 RepID=UPI00207680FA|nr:hypothetical protein [Pasteurella multocida]
MYLGHVKVLLGMFLSLKTLYRKRTVIWPFYFYTIIRTLSKDIDDYNDLVKRYNNLYEENTSLKSQIGDLKEEIKLIYQSTKRFLKDRISDFKAFKEVFKELADNISNISREKGLDSSFKKEFDRENKKKQTRGIR